jgi:hypothetical protein
MVLDGGSNAFALQLILQIGRASKAADPVNDANGMVERRNVVAHVRSLDEFSWRGGIG